MGWGILLAWASHALPHPWSWLGLPLAIASATLPRTMGTRTSFALGLLLEAGSLIFLWGPTPPPRPCTGAFEVAIEREVRTGRYEGVLHRSPDPDLQGRRVRLIAEQAVVGSTIAGYGTLRAPRDPANPGGFDEARWAASAGLVGTLRLDSSSARNGTSSSWNILCRDLSAAVRQILAERLDAPSADLWIATLLADGSRLPADVNTAFRQTGLYHMLSVSGFHLVVLGGAMIAVLSFLRAGTAVSALGALGIVWLYVAFLDFPDPAVRSGVAFSAFALARWTGRRAHAGNALGLGTGVLILSDPNCPFQAGVQLTVAATAALIWLSPGLERLLLPRRGPRWALATGKALVASVAATLATAPILAWNTGLVPWIGIPAGVLASGFFSAGFLAALAVVAAGSLPASWSAGFAGAADLCARAVLEIALRAGSWDAGWFEVTRPRVEFLFLWALLLVLCALCAAGPAVRRRAILGMALLAPAFLWLPEYPRNDDVLAIDFLAVGQGDAILLRLPGGTGWLVDGGPATRGPRPRDAGADVVVPALRALRVERLEGIVVTHPDLDHWGGIPSVVGTFRPRFLVEPGVANPDPSPGWDSARTEILAGGTRRVPVAAGQFLPLASRGALVALAPGATHDLPDRNSSSLVLSARWGRSRALLAGDAEGWAEERMVEHRADLRADLLKVAHHGSKGSSTSPFLEAVRPRWAVISCGERNRYGHPHPEALARITSVGPRLLDTREGAWEALLRRDGSIEVGPAQERWWKGPWRRGDLSLRVPWISNGPSRKSSTERASCAGRCEASSRPTTSCPTASPGPARTDPS